MLPRNIRNHRDNLGLLLVIACLVSLLPLALHGQENATRRR